MEDEQVVVYDTVSAGPRRVPFGEFATDRRLSRIAIKRPLPELGSAIPDAVAFARRIHANGEPFDSGYRLDTNRYYCSELVETAFRRAGQPLSEPIAIERLPNFADYSGSTIRLVEALTPIQRQQLVYMPGNDEYGIWSSR